MPEETEVLYVVHAQGPDDLYAAASKEEADTLAAKQNELVPPVIELVPPDWVKVPAAIIPMISDAATRDPPRRV